MPLFYIRKVFPHDEKNRFLFMPDTDGDRCPSWPSDSERIAALERQVAELTAQVNFLLSERLDERSARRNNEVHVCTLSAFTDTFRTENATAAAHAWMCFSNAVASTRKCSARKKPSVARLTVNLSYSDRLKPYFRRPFDYLAITAISTKSFPI